MVVQDLESSVALYTRVFGFEIVEDCVVETDAAMFLSGGATRKMRLVFLSLNRRSTMVELIQLLDASGNSLPASAAGRFDWNLTFLVNNLEHVRAAIGESGLTIASEEYIAALPKLGRSRVLYCRDREGCLIEFVAPA
jgi:catechol 2,3-dioxygenase-like lactoylglutathione lyase family enzyme